MISKFGYFFLGLAVVYILAFIWSSDKKNIKHKYLLLIILVQIIFAIFMLQSNIGMKIIGYMTGGFGQLIHYAHSGTEFVFGSLSNTKNNGFIFFFDVGMPIVLVSAIIGILQYFRILPLILIAVGWSLSKITGMGRLESFNAVSSLAVGQSENFINYKNIIGHLPANVLYTMAATAMSTVSLAVVGAYMSIIDPKYVCVALIMNMFGTFFVLNIINPYEKSKNSEYTDLQKHYGKVKQSFFEMLAEYILDGFKVAIIVSALLIGFIALLNLVDGIFQNVFGLTFRDILGYVFYPFAWILNINTSELLLSSKIMGTKIVTNEFVAMEMLAKHSQNLTEHTKAVVSVFLVSFANLSSIGIIIGAIQALNKEASIKVAKLSVKILYGAVLVSLLSAIVISFVVVA